MEKYINQTNRIERDGEVYYFPQFFSQQKSQKFFSSLYHHICWREESVKIFGKLYRQPRLVAWHGDENIFYRYSGLKLESKPWTTELLTIKKSLENWTQKKFNSVLLNLYRNQHDSNGWHSDDEKEMGKDPFIASLSFGESRDFLIKHKTDKKLQHKINLESGSLLIMQGSCQKNWRHCIP